MSFLRHREIYPSDGGLTLSAKPPLIVWMSFRLAIPRRVALQHCPPPLHQPATFCYDPLRSSTKFRRTATCPSFLCLTRGAHPSLRPWFPPGFPFQPPADHGCPTRLFPRGGGLRVVW